MLMLKVERYAATGAENGRVGLELARSDPPDLILCDVMMPEMDGFAVLEALRAEPRLAEIPFIFLTALDDRSSTRRGMNLGAGRLLPKPFTRNELMEAVNSRLKKFENLTQALAARLVRSRTASRRNSGKNLRRRRHRGARGRRSRQLDWQDRRGVGAFLGHPQLHDVFGAPYQRRDRRAAHATSRPPARRSSAAAASS